MIDQILLQIKEKPYIRITEPELEQLLKISTLQAEHDTLISGPIRILLANGRILVQEETLKGEILLRKFKTLVSAQNFVSERMTIYDKMWDGCGCKIDFYS